MAHPLALSLACATTNATEAAASPATNVTEPMTIALATSTRLRPGLAVNVVRIIMPRRNSVVMNSAPSAITAISPTSVPLKLSPSGSRTETYGAMSPVPVTVKVPPAA